MDLFKPPWLQKDRKRAIHAISQIHNQKKLAKIYAEVKGTD